MRGERIILCLHCGQQNRLSTRAPLELAKCARCSQFLAPSTKRTGPDRGKLVLLTLMAGSVVFLVYNHQPSSLRAPPSSPSAPRATLSDQEFLGTPADRGPDALRRAAAEHLPQISRMQDGDLAVDNGTTTEHPAAERDASPPQGPAIPLPMLKPALPVAIPTNPFEAELSRRGLTLEPALPVAISTGLVWVRLGRERIAPLEIRTPSDYNYFVKLIN